VQFSSYPFLPLPILSQNFSKIEWHFPVVSRHLYCKYDCITIYAKFPMLWRSSPEPDMVSRLPPICLFISWKTCPLAVNSLPNGVTRISAFVHGWKYYTWSYQVGISLQNISSIREVKIPSTTPGLRKPSKEYVHRQRRCLPFISSPALFQRWTNFFQGI